MTIANGFMQFPRSAPQDTITAFTVTPDGYAQCMQGSTFVITVNSGRSPVGSGRVAIVDADTGYIYATHTVSEGIANITLNNGINDYHGYHNIYVLYTGVIGTYKPSRSATVPYYVTKAPTLFAVNEGTSHNMSVSADGYVSFGLTTDDGYIALAGALTGSVTFRLYSTNESFIALASGSISAGAVTARIPAGTMALGSSYYLTGIYNGNGCVEQSTNGIGVPAGFHLTGTA